MIKRLGSGLVVLILLLTLLPLTSHANTTAPQVSLTLDKSSIAVGENVTLSVSVAGGSDVYGTSVDVVYDPTLLQFVQGTPGTVVTNGLSQSQYYTTVFPTNVTAGRRETAIALRLGDQAGVTGDGVIGTFTFKSLKEGSTAFAVNGSSVAVQMVNSQGQSIAFGAQSTSASLSIGQGTTLKLVPARGAVQVGDIFAVDINLDYPSNVAGVDVRVNFPTDLLQVVDGDGAPVSVVEGGSLFTVVAKNEVDATLGQVWFSAAASSPVNTGGRVARIRFKALALGSAAIMFGETTVKDPSSPNPQPIVHSKTNTTVAVIDGGIVVGKVVPPGRTETARSNVEIKLVGQNLKTNANPDGTFTLAGIPAGTQQLLIRYKNPSATGPAYHLYLAHMETVSIAAGQTVTLPEITLKGGDLNGDNIVELSDLIILAGTYGLNSSSTGFNSLADFNSDGIVELADLIILAGGYGLSGATIPAGE